MEELTRSGVRKMEERREEDVLGFRVMEERRME